MSIESKNLISQLDTIVSLPSVSSAIPELDTSNREVIEFLANSFDSLGFSCEIIPCNSNINKVNLIATLGSGPGGLVLAAIPIPFHLMTNYGHTILLKSQSQKGNFTA